jgi:muramoyltetrapeptide carboxypeptidase
MFGDFMTEIIKPPRLKLGDTIGIFTPSNPAAVKYPEKYLHGLEELKRTGFKILEGSLTKNRASQGFRSGTPQERAQEFMDLYLDPWVVFSQYDSLFEF